MNFKDLKIGCPFYLLNKDDLTLVTTSISNISVPHIENKVNSPTQLVVDITLNVDGKPITYVTPDTGCISYCGQQILTCDKQLLISEIKAIKTQNEQILASQDKATENVLKCDDLISALDDAFREKKENDERLNKLEGMMKTILDKISSI